MTELLGEVLQSDRSVILGAVKVCGGRVISDTPRCLVVHIPAEEEHTNKWGTFYYFLEGVSRVMTELYDIHFSVYGPEFQITFNKPVKEKIMNETLNDVLDFLEENGSASMADLIDALDCDKEDIREAIRTDGKLDSRLQYDKSTSLYNLR